MLAFFQSTENRFLSEAKDKFASDDAKKFVDLNAIYQILKLCFTENDVARSGDKLLAVFRQQRTSSPWVPLLRSCLHYSRGEFATAAADVEKVPVGTHSPLLDAFVYFRGVNYLRTFIAKANSGTDHDPLLLTKARSTFVEAEELAQKSTDEYFRQIASGSAQIFRESLCL